MMPMAYHFATFSSNASAAAAEAIMQFKLRKHSAYLKVHILLVIMKQVRAITFTVVKRQRLMQLLLLWTL